MDNSKSEIYDGYTAPSADPSERRLTVYLSSTGVKAYLKHSFDATAGYRTLIDTSWKCDRKDILSRIENAVYDHPDVLDDFECDVIVESDKVIWMPQEIADDDDARDAVYTAIYPVDPDDIFIDRIDDGDCGIAAVYYLCNGLPAFLRRTFPGARISSQQTHLYRRFKGRVNDDTSVFVDIRDSYFDILIFKADRLMLGASHRFVEITDASYHILNCIRQTNSSLGSCEVYLSGDRETRSSLISDLREEISYVRNTMLPRIDAPLAMPTAALICATSKKISNENNQR